MKDSFSIQYVGGSEEEAAHLRLLLRQTASRLDAKWRWDDDTDEPDLLLADPGTFAGDAALDQARNGGRPFVCVVDRDTPDSGDWQLRRPFKADALVRVVNALSPAAPSGPSMFITDENFFSTELDGGGTLELLDEEAYASIPTGAGGPDRRSPEELRGDDSIFRRDPTDSEPRFAVPQTLDEATTVDPVSGLSTRSRVRKEEIRERMNLGLGEIQAAESLRERPTEDLRLLALVDFLDPRVLPAPARTAHGGLAPLILDPRNQCFHAAVDLGELELYCLQLIPVASWQRLTTRELEEARQQMPARPWALLRWLYRLLNSNQRLAQHLDPGGRYWLTAPLELPADYRSQQAILAAMGEPLKLNEIAAAAGASVGEVINVVNACDAIGILGWELRDRLRRDAP